MAMFVNSWRFGSAALAFADIVAADLPWAWWKLDENSGAAVAIDASSHGRDLAYGGFNAARRALPGLIADSGTCIECASGDNLDGNLTAFSGNVPLSLAGIVKRTVGTGDNYVIHNGNFAVGGGQGQYLGVNAAGAISFQCFAGGTWQAASSPNGVVPVNTTCIVGWAHDPVADTLKFYCNGALVGTVAYAAGLGGGASSTWAIGKVTGAGVYSSNMRIDHGMVFDKVLPADRWMAQARAAGLANVAWNQGDCAVEITLTDANATATRSSTTDGAWRSVRSVTSHSTGKWYAECLDVADASTNGSQIFGVGKAAAGLSSYPGVDANSWGNQANNVGGVFDYLAGTAVNTGETNIVAGGYAKVAIDFDAGKGWFGNSAVLGNGWYGSGNPATGANPTFTFTPGTPLFLMLGMFHTPQQCTLRNTTASVIGAVPTGFTAWGDKDDAAKHRFWRINISANNGNTSFGAGADEIEFRSTVGGADQTSAAAAATAASASSVINGSNTASMAFDENGGARWLSAAGLPQWIQWDFGVGNEKNILQFTISGPNTAITASPKDFTLEYSDDGLGWTVVKTVTGETGWASGVPKVFNV